MTERTKRLEDQAKAERRKEALRYLERRTNYEKVRSIPYDRLGDHLPRLRAALRFLGSPDRKMRTIHLAGTKGKGTTAMMIERILRDQGAKTGLFTSPHLFHLEERFALNGVPCPSDDLTDVILDLKSRLRDFDRLVPWTGEEPTEANPLGTHPGMGASDPPSPTGEEAPPFSFFELTVLAAFLLFARYRVDFLILETGLGGRIDATNITRPVLSVITSVLYDHQEQLGGTLDRIAREKAGIIQSRVPVISGVAADWESLPPESDAEKLPPRFRSTFLSRERVLEAEEVVRRRAEEMDAPFLSIRRLSEEIASLPLATVGDRQPFNAQIALAAVENLRNRGIFPVDLRQAQRSLTQMTFPARGEILSDDPLILIDGAHNRASVASLVRDIRKRWPDRPKTLIFAALHGKDVEGMFWELFPHFDRILLTGVPDNPRGFSANEITKIAFDALPDFPDKDALERRIQTVEDIQTELPRLLQTPVTTDGKSPLFCFVGSFYFAANLLRDFKKGDGADILEKSN